MRSQARREGTTSYTFMYALAVIVAVLSAVIGALQLANPEELGISPQVIAWTKIITPGLAILAGFLPSVRKPPDSQRQGLD